MLTIDEVLNTFRGEYSTLLGKFAVHDLTLDKAPEDIDSSVNAPGVYVFWKQGHGVIKVGKSQTNSKVRALQHIYDNTKNEKIEMTTLEKDQNCHLLLFNVAKQSDLHWILSLECFFEWNLKPVIPSRRCG
jgi:hypothetical protein